MCLWITLFLVGCHSGLNDEGTVTTQNGDVFEIKSRFTITGSIYSIKDGDSLLIEVGDDEIRSTDFEQIYDSDRVKAYLFYKSYILVSVNNGSFQLVDEDFAFDEVPEVDEMIAENLIRIRGSINEYYDIFKQRQPQKYASLIDAYKRKNYDVLSEFELPTAPGPKDSVMTHLEGFIERDSNSDLSQP